jgi:hypothetical protein
MKKLIAISLLLFIGLISVYAGIRVDSLTVNGEQVVSKGETTDANTGEVSTNAIILMPGGAEMVSRIIDVTTNDSIHDAINSIGKYIHENVTVTVKLGSGIHDVTNSIVIKGFYGGGQLQVAATNHDAVNMATNQTTTIRMQNIGSKGSVYPVVSYGQNNNARVLLVGIKFEVTGDTTNAPRIILGNISYRGTAYLGVYYCYFKGTSAANITGALAVDMYYNDATVTGCAFDNVREAIGAKNLARIFVSGSGSVGTPPYAAFDVTRGFIQCGDNYTGAGRTNVVQGGLFIKPAGAILP